MTDRGVWLNRFSVRENLGGATTHLAIGISAHRFCDNQTVSDLNVYCNALPIVVSIPFRQITQRSVIGERRGPPSLRSGAFHP